MFLLRVFKICSALYLFAAVLHTTSQLFSSPVHAGISLLAKCRFPSLVASSFQSLLVKRTASKNIQFVPQDQISLQSRTSQEIVLWTSSPFALENGLGHSDPIPMSEDLFLSKAFSSLRPSKIIPFFYRRTGSFEADDITITTLVTSNRLQVFARLVERYSGPISVTIHIKNSSENVHELLDSIHSVYTSTTKMSSNVDVHLVVDAFDRQFNTWRNIARFFARTDFVMMLDIDFSPCTDFRSAIRSSSAMMEKLRTGTAAFVVPAFEYPKHEDGIDAARFPQTKTELIAQVDSGKITVFHAFWGPGHSSTHYERYYASSPGEVYRVDSYQAAYEPYVIFKKDGPPWCDERFVGYGGNKAACLFEMYLSGISLYVLSDHFLVHQNHLYEETARRAERKFNRKIYSDFREEACLRYLTAFRDNGQLNTDRASNARNECSKIRSIARFMAQVSS